MKTHKILFLVGVLGVVAGRYLFFSNDKNNGLFSIVGSGFLMYWSYAGPRESSKRD